MAKSIAELQERTKLPDKLVAVAQKVVPQIPIIQIPEIPRLNLEIPIIQIPEIPKLEPIIPEIAKAPIYEPTSLSVTQEPPK